MSETAVRLLAEIQAAVQDRADWAVSAVVAAPHVHLAVMSEPFVSSVFSGRKTVESRFSLHQIAPYGRVQSGDVVCMKAGPIIGCFTVSWVRTYDLQAYPIAEIVAKYGQSIAADEAFWRHKRTARYATLMGIRDVQRLTSLSISKHDRRAWLTLN